MYLGREKRLKEGFPEGFTQEMTFEQDLFDHRTLFYRTSLNISQHTRILGDTV